MSALRIEPRLEPPEPAAALYCDRCEEAIYPGEDYMELPDGERLCESCFDLRAKEWKRTADSPETWSINF